MATCPFDLNPTNEDKNREIAVVGEQFIGTVSGNIEAGVEGVVEEVEDLWKLEMSKFPVYAQQEMKDACRTSGNPRVRFWKSL